MYRTAIEKLYRWKNAKRRKPLIIEGARQVGKTWLMKEFGRRAYDDTVYINFDSNARMAQLFSSDLDTDRLVMGLELYAGRKIEADRTLLIFDEIQVCERALTSLKYFSEDAPEYHIVAAGSLLGVALHREKYSFPVGKVIMKTMYPLTFDEFLRAMGNGHLVQEIREHFERKQEMPQQTHMELINWLRRYLFVGGMPAVVKKYREEQSLVNVQELQEMILNAYTADMAKYSSAGDCTKIRNAFQSLPAQLAKDNKKFQYKLIRKGATAGLFGDSISWLVMAGIALECGRVTRGEVPVKISRDISSFKLYMSDVGLLSCFSGIMPENVIRQELSDVYKGALAENYVAQALRAGEHELYYWTSDAPAAEVDFLIQKKGKVIPVEVKYDQNVRARSMKHFSNIYHPEEMIRISARNFGVDENGLTSVPLYAVFCI